MKLAFSTKTRGSKIENTLQRATNNNTTTTLNIIDSNPVTTNDTNREPFRFDMIKYLENAQTKCNSCGK